MLRGWVSYLRGVGSAGQNFGVLVGGKFFGVG